MSVKYYISFTSDTELNNRIEFDIEGYSGDPIELDGAGCSILYDGEDMSDPIITSRASLRVNYHEQFFADTRDADDKQIPVTIYHGNKKWIGFLVSDNRDETFDKTNYPLELTCLDPFSYIRGLQNDLFRDTDLFGRQSVEMIIKSVFSYVLTGLDILVLNDTIPTGATGNIINNTYLFTQVFQDENGIYINGYDIIEKIMSDLVMTAIFFNGQLVLRNNRYMEGANPVEIGINNDGDNIFWIGNSELITRTRGAKETSRSLSYPEMSSLFANPFFYYKDDTKPVTEQVRGWFYQYPWYDVESVEYIGSGREKSPYGFRIKGFGVSPINDGKDVGPLWSTSIIELPTTVAPDWILTNMVLKIKYRYGRYPIVLDGDGNQKKITLAVNLIARDLGGSGKVLYYNNEGKTGIGNYSVTQWEAVVSNSLPRIYFPMDNTEDIQEVEIAIPNVTNYGFTGDAQFDIILWNVGSYNGNDSIVAEGGGVSLYPDIVEYFEANLSVTREKEAYYNGNGNFDKYSTEEVYITNVKNFSQIADTIDLSIGRSYFISGRDLNGLVIKRLDKYNKSSLTYANGDAIEFFNQPPLGDQSILELGAKSEMYFNRIPRYQIDAVIRGDINITQVFTSPKVIPGKYICVKDEYDLYLGTHDMTLQELRGSDENDIIENFLSTN